MGILLPIHGEILAANRKTYVGKWKVVRESLDAGRSTLDDEDIDIS